MSGIPPEIPAIVNPPEPQDFNIVEVVPNPPAIPGDIPAEPGEPHNAVPSPPVVPELGHPNDPTEEEDVDSVKLAQLLDFGFDEFISELALKRTKGQTLEDAVNWVIDHSNESDLEEDSDSDSEEDQQPGAEEEELSNAMGAALSSGDSSGSAGPSVPRGQMVALMKAMRPARTHKMVFVANTSLKMGVGKLAAQVGHATLGVYKHAAKSPEGQRALEAWQSHGAVKVVVKGQSTEQLLDMFKQAKELNVYAYLVQDAGYTQIPPGSRTILGLFGPVEDIDKVSGTLKLY